LYFLFKCWINLAAPITLFLGSVGSWLGIYSSRIIGISCIIPISPDSPSAVGSKSDSCFAIAFNKSGFTLYCFPISSNIGSYSVPFKAISSSSVSSTTSCCCKEDCLFCILLDTSCCSSSVSSISEVNEIPSTV